MTLEPAPAHKEDYGIIGAIRVFTVDGVEWRAFEYRGLGHSAPETKIVLIAEGVSYDAGHLPDDWRSMPPERLVELARAVPARPIRRSTPERGDVAAVSQA